MLIAERSKIEKQGNRFSWAKIAKVLNAEGPCVKNPGLWRAVRKRMPSFLSFGNLNTFFYLVYKNLLKKKI